MSEHDIDLRVGLAGVATGQIWRRMPPGRERLRIERVWQGYLDDHPDIWTVRAQPIHGGRVVVTSPHWITEHYCLEANSDA
jgi:hypothetical protein